jgi:hypothetical protein
VCEQFRQKCGGRSRDQDGEKSNAGREQEPHDWREKWSGSNAKAELPDPGRFVVYWAQMCTACVELGTLLLPWDVAPDAIDPNQTGLSQASSSVAAVDDF